LAPPACASATVLDSANARANVIALKFMIASSSGSVDEKSPQFLICSNLHRRSVPLASPKSCVLNAIEIF
jgi:hypothetical protein